jgi:hypothetical protein
MGKNSVYRGWLREGYNGETEVLEISDNLAERGRILAELVANDMITHGRYLSVRYYLTDIPCTPECLNLVLMETLFGEGAAEYNMVYSEATGYLCTDENLSVGGHDLMGILENELGRFLHLEIDYHKTAEAPLM